MRACTAAWLAGESVPGFYQSCPTLLRVKGERIETSRQASVGIAHARQLWSLAHDTRKRGASVCFPRGAFEVDGFQLREIAADGTVTIGCHVLNYDVMLGIAKQLGWEV